MIRTPRITGPICPHCRRPLLVVAGKCLCCGTAITQE